MAVETEDSVIWRLQNLTAQHFYHNLKERFFLYKNKDLVASNLINLWILNENWRFWEGINGLKSLQQLAPTSVKWLSFKSQIVQLCLMDFCRLTGFELKPNVKEKKVNYFVSILKDSSCVYIIQQEKMTFRRWL